MKGHKEETSKELDGLLIIVMHLIAYLVPNSYICIVINSFNH